jgi:CBS domain-containing protein
MLQCTADVLPDARFERSLSLRGVILEARPMTVAMILKSKGSHVETVRPDASLQDIVERLAKRRIGAVLVTSLSGDILGIVSERDVVFALGNGGGIALQRRAEEVMTKNLVTCTREDRAEELMEMMTKGRFRHVPVVEDGRLLGIVSIGDVVKRRIEDTDSERAAMRDYIASAG